MTSTSTARVVAYSPFADKAKVLNDCINNGEQSDYYSPELAAPDWPPGLNPIANAGLNHRQCGNRRCIGPQDTWSQRDRRDELLGTEHGPLLI